MPIEEALKEAKSEKLDLVEIAPLADPVVCKILDYGKHVFEAKRLLSNSIIKIERNDMEIDVDGGQ